MVQFAFLLACISWAFNSAREYGVLLALLAVFGLGYYVLPVALLKWSPLASYPSSLVTPIQWMNIIYWFVLFLAYATTARTALAATRNDRFTVFDRFLSRHWAATYCVAFGICAWHYSQSELTSYSAADFEGFFLERGPLSAILAAASSYSLALMTTIIAYAHNRVHRRERAFLWLPLLIIVLMLTIGGQRLLVLTPLLMLAGAFWAYGELRQTWKILLLALAILLIFSPFAVAMRGFQGEEAGRHRLSEAFARYTDESSSTLESSLKSLVERADLLENSIHLKQHFDHSGFANQQYYVSVALAPFPRALVPDKPYPLSDDGTVWGEISVIAWRIMLGDTLGSLTAFGAITAYRQAGWLGVLIDGLACGALLVGLQWAVFSLSGPGRYFMFSLVLPVMAVKRVPGSFLEIIVELIPLIPAFFVCKFVLARRSVPQ